ncbi:hypothetical protein V5R04_06770 [Jonesiaceae bacterium BS-20]|uniref:Uncharacterized protein n=1 Tax=Jonesiaceae bacterium BS-20 TaxID=3120821 RepID=A0AAU7E048_9MICO
MAEVLTRRTQLNALPTGTFIVEGKDGLPNPSTTPDGAVIEPKMFHKFGDHWYLLDGVEPTGAVRLPVTVLYNPDTLPGAPGATIGTARFGLQKEEFSTHVNTVHTAIRDLIKHEPLELDLTAHDLASTIFDHLVGHAEQGNITLADLPHLLKDITNDLLPQPEEN